jgi:flagellar biosynthesis/type III secretory pathway protein FliH
MFSMVANMVAAMAKKLQLMIPVDFESIILGQMAPILTKYYKNGAIMIYVNPERVDYCNNLVKIKELPLNMAENIKIISDDAISYNDCKIEWQDAMLQYNQEELALEIEKILANLKI